MCIVSVVLASLPRAYVPAIAYREGEDMRCLARSYGGWSVQSYRLAACLNVLRRVYSSYQFPGKYLHFRATLVLPRSPPEPAPSLSASPSAILCPLRP